MWTAEASPTQTDRIQIEEAERRYPTRQRKAPEYLKEYQCKAEYDDAMKEELNSLTENMTFTLTPLPRGEQAMGGCWVYTLKESPDGSEICKSRYVAKGYGQVEGIDEKETFSVTANMTSVRALECF